MANILNYTSSTLVSGTSAADSIYNASSYVTIKAGGGNDSITNFGYYATINAGAGKDLISLSGYKNVIQYASGDGNDTVFGFNAYDTLYITKGTYAMTKSGKDVIVTVGKNSVLIKSDDGSETITIMDSSGKISTYNNWKKWNGSIKNNIKSNVTLSGSKKGDTIGNSGYYVTINAGAGNDSIINYESSEVTISGGAGNDSISNSGNGTTITGGAGNDFISLSSDNNVIQYESGGGKDTVFGFDDYDTLYIAKGKYTTQFSNGDFVVKSGKGKIILKDIEVGHVIHLKSANGTVSTIKCGFNKIYNSESNTLVSGENENGGNDSIYSSGSNVTIQAGAGHDSILNYGSTVTAMGGSGNDRIINYGGNKILMAGNDGNDYIRNHADATLNAGLNITMTGGKGEDTLINFGSNVTMTGGDDSDYLYTENGDNVKIFGGAGNDKIYNHEVWYSTISSGKDNDFISIGSYANKNVITYANGDGVDVVYGFNDDDTLKITKGSYAISVSGDDVIVTVGKGSITLKNATSKNISIADSKGKVENKTFASSALLEEENNFSELDMIVEKDFELSDIQDETTQIISPSKSATPNLILSPAR